MRLKLEQIEHGMVLKGIAERLTLESLVELLRKQLKDENDPGSSSFGKLVKSGGEAFVRLHESTVLRFEMKLLDPHTSMEVREEFLKRLSASRKLLPEGALKPELPIYLDGSSMVIGHTMPYVDNLVSFEDGAPIWSGDQANKALLGFHRYIKACHASQVKLGEVNITNSGIDSNGSFVAWDTLGYDLPGFPCQTTCSSTIDPSLIIQDDSIDDLDKRMWERERPYSFDSDWYGFACIVLQVLVGVGPWRGTHRLARSCKELRRERVRALRGVSIFDSNIKIDSAKLLRVPEALSEPLYNHLYGVFNERQRGEFPELLLTQQSWRRCSKCGKELASIRCVACVDR